MFFNLSTAAAEPSANVLCYSYNPTMIQVSILLQPHRTVVANFLQANLVCFGRTPVEKHWITAYAINITLSLLN